MVNYRRLCAGSFGVTSCLCGPGRNGVALRVADYAGAGAFNVLCLFLPIESRYES